MKRMTKLGPIPVLLLVAAACGPGELVVTAEVERMDPETGETVVMPIENLDLQLLPFDRDFIFDSLTAAADAPEPQLPPALALARDSIMEAQQQWRSAETQWLELRDRLQQVSQEMTQYNPAEARYRQLFDEFNRLEGAYNQADAARDQAFTRFDRLQQETFSEMEEYRVLVDAWEDDAFAPYGEVAAERLRSTRREILADTTTATGRATFRPAPGEWWVVGRYPVATEELYWNIPVQIERGDPVEIRLNRDNAEVRPLF